MLFLIVLLQGGEVASARLLHQEQMPGLTNATTNATAAATPPAAGAPPSLAALPQCQNYSSPSPFYDVAFLGPQLTVAVGKLPRACAEVWSGLGLGVGGKPSNCVFNSRSRVARVAECPAAAPC
jgi:hypothetical protein